MALTYLTPGVYVEELAGGARTIEGVATSVALFLGYTRRGPTDEAVRIASWGEYERRFGGVVDGEGRGINDLRQLVAAPDTRLPAVDHFGHSVFAYFQNGGAVAYIRRLVEGDDPDPNAPLPLATAESSIMAPAPLTFEAADPGTWADGLVVDVAADELHPGRFLVRIGRFGARGELAVLERFENVALAADQDGFLGAELERRSALVRLADEAPDAPSIAPQVLRGRHRSRDVAAVDLDLTDAAEDDRRLTVSLGAGADDEVAAAVPARRYQSLDELADVLGTALRAADLRDDATADLRTARDGLTVTVLRDGAARFLEIRSGLTGTASVAAVDAAGLGATLQFSAGDAQGGGDGLDARTQAVLFGGGDGHPPLTADLYVDALEVQELNPDVNVILTPNAAWDPAGRPIVEAVLAHCRRLRNRVTIIDPPVGTELTTPVVVNGLGLPTDTYAQLYYPWVRVTNPVHHPVRAPGAPLTVLVPPAGFAAGMWSRIDARRGVWKAPAGVEALLAGVEGFEFDVGDPQQQVLNPAGVNVLRAKPGYGRVIWGARTLATNADPEWRYIPVRRTAIMIEEALRRGIQWAVFEPNDEQLWSSLRLAGESFMNGLFRSGAFQGATASNAYQVSCGLGTTMEQGDIDRGYVILKVAFRPLKPAEFVVIQIQQLAGQA